MSLPILSVDPRRPQGSGWVPDLLRQRQMRREQGPVFARIEAWQHGQVLVLSNVEDVTPGGVTWHCSVSEAGGRPGRSAMRLVRRAFGMEEAEEDNHSPGQRIRSLWLPVDPAQRKPCACVVLEEPTLGDAGMPGDLDRYVWRPGLVEQER